MEIQKTEIDFYALLQPLHLMPKGLQKALSSQHFYNFQLNINASVVHA